MKKTLLGHAMYLGAVALAIATIVDCDASNTGQPFDVETNPSTGGAGNGTRNSGSGGFAETRTTMAVGGNPADSTSTSSQNPSTCSTPTACGGTLDGTWQIIATCIDDDLAHAMQDLAALPAACSTLFQTAKLDYSGTVRYANGIETPNIRAQLDVLAIYTAACYSTLNNGTKTLDAVACSSIKEAALQAGEFTEATCTYATGECRCQYRNVAQNTESSTYTANGGQIAYANGDTPIGYCVSGTTLTESQTSADLGGLTFSLTLDRTGN
ncbi:MAG TPA: hypothetical protein VIV60_16170 [Polyangiaceae bacterium]